MQDLHAVDRHVEHDDVVDRGAADRDTEPREHRLAVLAQHADLACLAEAAMHVVAPAGEQFGDQVARQRFLEGQLRVGVDAAAHLGQFGGDRCDAGNDGLPDCMVSPCGVFRGCVRKRYKFLSETRGC